jgi:hypothetical protein
MIAPVERLQPLFFAPAQFLHSQKLAIYLSLNQ